MNLREELILRCARRREAKLGSLSPRAFDELLENVREDVGAFIDTPQDVAFAELVRAVETYERELRGLDALDDEAYGIERTRILNKLRKACQEIRKTDPGCIDAQHILAAQLDNPLSRPNEAFDFMMAFGIEYRPSAEAAAEMPGGTSWDNVFIRPHLRMVAGLARQAVATTRYTLAASCCLKALEACPTDEVGARHTMAIAWARLEDEEGLNELDDRFNHESTAWSLLARALLLYRLERYDSARRALRSFARLVDGGAYALLMPVLLPPYLPARPEADPLGFDAAMQAVYEAETVISDTPGFIAWAQSQPEVVTAAKNFADTHGFEWNV